MLQTKFVEEIKTRSVTFGPKIVLFVIMWKKYGKARQATYNNVIRRMRVACWITKATGF